MLRILFTCLVNAEAITGVVLTLGWLFGEPDLELMTIPLYSIGALLILYAFISGGWIRSPSRLEAQVTSEETVRQIHQEIAARSRMPRLSQFATRHRMSVQWALTGGWLLLTAWLLSSFAPPLGG